MTDEPSGPELAAELEDLRARLAEAEEVLQAIRNGEVDALVVAGENGEHVYTLRGADRVYRQLIETMSEGAVTLSADGVILYCNVCLAEMLGQPLDQVLGTALRNYLPPADQQALDAVLAQARTAPSRREINLKSSKGRLVPVYLSVSRLHIEGAEMVFCLVLTDMTEQKNHERIVAAERLARLVLEQAAEAIVVCDEQGRVIRASQAAQQFCDGSPLLQPFAEVFPLRTYVSDPFHLAPVLQGKTLRNVDVALDRQGRKFDLILNAGPLLSGQQILGCVVTLTDITERKRAEEALRESEEKYRLLIDTANESIIVAQDGLLKFVNPITLDLLGGYSEQELMDRPFPEFIHPDDRSMVVENYRRRIANEAVQPRYSFRVVTRDGLVKWVKINAALMEWQGKPATLNFLADITERKQAEEELRQERELYLDLVNTQPAGIYRSRVLSGKFLSEEKWRSSKDAPYSLELVSDRFCEILKLDRQAFHDNPGIVNDLVFKADKEEFARKNIEANSRMIPFIWEGRLVIGGALLWVHFESHPRPLEDGDTLWTGILYDITERKRAEEAVQASLREKEILLREIHHRVKNNMQIISSLFNLQSRHIKDEGARRMLKEGQSRIRSMALVHEKLYQSSDLSKIDFADYLRSLSVHLFHFFMIEDDRIRLETDLEEDVHLDINSAVPCGLLVTELITNALKHAFPGDRKGMIGIGLHRKKDGAVELRVSDDGVGFPEAVDFRNTESLGLQIVAMLVGQLEGTIELDRKNGTAFTVVFRELEYKART